jgi:hypothetical protein
VDRREELLLDHWSVRVNAEGGGAGANLRYSGKVARARAPRRAAQAR